MKLKSRLNDIVTGVISSAMFPLHESLKGHHSLGLRRELERTQWLSAPELRTLQVSRLRAFLLHASEKVPYYRRLFTECRFDPKSIHSLDDLTRVPTLTKSLIRKNSEALIAEGAKTLKRSNTGGSTGEPLVFCLGRDRVSHDVAAKWRATRWWGVDIGDPEVVLWGSPIEVGNQDRIKSVRDRLFRTHLLPAFQMSPQQMNTHLDFIAARKPRMLFGYASALALLAEHAIASGRDMKSLGIRVAFATAETLYPHQKASIENVFACPVANGYGARDAGFIAHECPAGSLHVCAEHIIVELLDEFGQPVELGASGEIVTTHMATGEFPFVRYRTGDMAIATGDLCICGRGLPVIRSVEGRSTDFVSTPSGNKMHALALIYEVRDKPGVRAFKFIQSADLSVELLLVGDVDLTTAIENQIKTRVLARLGPGAIVSTRRVNAIPPEPSGKYRYVVSHVAPSAPLRAIPGTKL